jgi:hypothetical protein
MEFGEAQVLLNLGEPGAFDIPPWADRVQLVDAKYIGPWELPALGPVTAPTAVLVRPDGYVALVGDLTQPGLADALTTWFGPPAAAKRAPASRIILLGVLVASVLRNAVFVSDRATDEMQPCGRGDKAADSLCVIHALPSSSESQDRVADV